VQQALSSRRFGPYTLQAAIAAVHAEAPTAAATDWPQFVGLYDVLMRTEPSPVVELAAQEPERRFLRRRLREL
jgi:RNA polymerase sigma-70 factor (ECF subfamily)